MFNQDRDEAGDFRQNVGSKTRLVYPTNDGTTGVTKRRHHAAAHSPGYQPTLEHIPCMNLSTL